MSVMEKDELLGIIREVQSGQKSALGALFDATASQLNALAMRVVRNHADAEDVLSDVYKQVWERPQQYASERGPVIAWLLVITRTRALDLLRKRRSDHSSWESNSVSLAAELEHQESVSADIVQAVQEKTALKLALLQLTDEQRRMLDLAYNFDMSHQEIADQTGIALGTVKSHIRRGQQALKATLESQGLNAQAFGVAPSMPARSAS
jgi:RNA polymerase sigma-70 factor, ECF subfamily